MAQRPAAESIIADVYDAAVAPDGLQRLAEIVTEVADGGSADLCVLHGNGLEEAATCNLPVEALENYAAYYQRLNPYIPVAIAHGVSQVTRGSDLLSDVSVRQLEFYTDFQRVYDTVRMLGNPRIRIGAGRTVEIGVHRGVRAHEFSRRDVHRLQILLPYLQRGLQLRQKLGAGLHPDIGLAVLERLAFGCVVCDRAGRILFANEAACALEAAGRITLAALRHGIGAPAASQSRQLAVLIARTAAGGSGGAVALAAGDGARLFALVTPLPRRIGWQPGHVLVMLQSEAAGPAFDAEKLRMLFGLTSAEARLALAVAAGRSLAAIGAELRVTENTLRTQIASVLRKTDTANQRELVRILNLPPPLRDL